MEQLPTPLVNFNDACKILNIKPSRLRTAILKKEIPYIKIGRLIRFDPIDLNKWIKSLKTFNKSYSEIY